MSILLWVCDTEINAHISALICLNLINIYTIVTFLELVVDK